MEAKISLSVEAALTAIGASNTSFVVERPIELSHGDYTTNAALAAAKSLDKNPRAVAEFLVENLQRTLKDSVQSIVVAGPGFINFSLTHGAVSAALAEADTAKESWGAGKNLEGKRIIIEYSNPNAFKEMHIGHLVGTVIGEALSRLIQNNGATLARDTFGGDVGPNVAKALWALRKNHIDPATAAEIGKAYAEGSTAYESDPTAKEEIDALNQAIYKREDPEVMALWQRGREISMEEFRRLWKLLGSHFDFEFFDSDTTEGARRIVADGLAKGIFKQSDGAIIYDGESKGVHTMVFITSHDTPTYEAKDLGLAFLKEERWPSDCSIIVTANEQTGRFKTVLAALSEIAPVLARKTEHIATGFLKLTSGKMSSREGNTITASELIREITERASEKNSDPLVAEQVAVGAIKYMILRQTLGSDIIFDTEKSLSLEGDSGPYLQYALVRAKSVIEKAPEESQHVEMSAELYPIERTILHFPEVAARAEQERAPNLLVNFLVELAGEWNSFYAKERIIGDASEKHKLLIARAFVQTMTNGLSLLGIPMPEKM